MENQALLLLVEFGAPLITIGLWWQIWNFRKYLQETSSSAAKAVSDSAELKAKVEALGRDHEEIKETSKDINRKIDDFSEKVEVKIERILIEHSAHEKDQAVILEILRDLKNKDK